MKKYIVAVSGGVDSVALLDMLTTKKIPDGGNLLGNYELVVAHFDHGIRPDSMHDAEFVRDLASQYGLAFEGDEGALGPGASEEQARLARYAFLKKVQQKHTATAVITAHHHDDLLETAVINLLRGTNWRGLSSLSSREELLRPLLTVTKAQLQEYATTHNLKWREDSTNADPKYLRNYVRLTLIPKLLQSNPEFKVQLHEVAQAVSELKVKIEKEIEQLLSRYSSTDTSFCLPRHDLIMWPKQTAQEVIYSLLTTLDPNWHPNRLQIEKSLIFVKTGLPGKKIEISKQLEISLTSRHAEFKKK